MKMGGGIENSGGFHNTSNVSPEDMGSFQNEEVSRVSILAECDRLCYCERTKIFVGL